MRAEGGDGGDAGGDCGGGGGGGGAVVVAVVVMMVVSGGGGRRGRGRGRCRGRCRGGGAGGGGHGRGGSGGGGDDDGGGGEGVKYRHPMQSFEQPHIVSFDHLEGSVAVAHTAFDHGALRRTNREVYHKVLAATNRGSRATQKGVASLGNGGPRVD